MWLTELWADPYLRSVVLRAFVVGVFLSLCAALLGVTLVLKRFSMIGDGLSHVGFGALALATVLELVGDLALEFAIVIVMLCSFLLFWLTGRGKLKGDAAIAVLSSSAVAVGVLLYDLTGGMTGDACNSLFGSASLVTVTQKDMWVAVGLSAIVILLYVFLYRRIFAVTFDETFAKATGTRLFGYQGVLSVLISVTVVLGMKMMGAIMISALIIFPVLSAMRLCKSFKGVVLSGGVIAVVCFAVGFGLSVPLGLPTGPCVVLANLAMLLTLSLLQRCKRN